MALDALLSFALLVGVVVFIYGPWQRYCTDRSRQIIFEQRARLFNLAAKGPLSFESIEYKIIRRALNQNIRFAHELTWPAFLAFFLGVKKRKIDFKRSELYWAMVRVEEITDRETKVIVRDILFRSQLALIEGTFLKSPILWIGLPAYLVAAALFYCVNSIKSQIVEVLLNTGAVVQSEATYAATHADHPKPKAALIVST